MSTEIIGGFKFTGRYLLDPAAYSRRQGDINHLVVHCSATKATWNGGVEEIRSWHINDNLWSDVGYHFVIRRDGTVERGRPVWAVGAGVAGYNAHSIHICLVGGLDNDGKPEDNFAPVQKAALAFLLSNLKRLVANKAKVCGHRDFPGVTKACPSFDAIKWWSGAEASATNNPVKGFSFEQIVRGDAYWN